MTDVQRLLREYIADHREGREADPVEYLDRVEGLDREELAALIDAYLQRSPGEEWNPGAYRASAAERLVEGLDRSLRGQAGLWPTLLPRLRNRAQIKRRELVEWLARTLGVDDRVEKVAGYYNQMEQGTIESTGVSDRVVDALSQKLGVAAAALRRAGEPLGEVSAIEGEPVFMRAVQHDSLTAEPSEISGARPEQDEWDDVDELFRGRSQS